MAKQKMLSPQISSPSITHQCTRCREYLEEKDLLELLGNIGHGKIEREGDWDCLTLCGPVTRLEGDSDAD